MTPRIAVVDANVLTGMGLKTLLQSVMPGMEIGVYFSFEELMRNHPEGFVHFFANVLIVLEHQDFFMQNRLASPGPLCYAGREKKASTGGMILCRKPTPSA